MKYIILNCELNCVEVIPVETYLEEELRSGKIDAEELLSNKGVLTEKVSWMLSYDNEVPVYWGEEEAPFTIL